jgi:CheY-like chemotaxis protein
LGLSVLHGIVHSASGHVTVLTKVGQGTEFRVYLPAQLREANGAIATRELKPEAKSGQVCGKVMVVDDEASIVGFLTVLLEDLGCSVIGLTSAAEALRVFQEDPSCVDMVIADQTMPGWSGADLASAMLARRPDLPIVISTDDSDAIDDDTARKIGVRRFLMKPVPAKVLADIVAEFLAAKSIRA